MVFFATHMRYTHWPHSQSEDERTCHTRSSPNRPVGIDLSSYRLPGEECFLLWTVIETKTVKRTMSTSVTSVPNGEPGHRDFVDPWTGQVWSQDGFRVGGGRYQLSRQTVQTVSLGSVQTGGQTWNYLEWQNSISKLSPGVSEYQTAGLFLDLWNPSTSTNIEL